MTEARLRADAIQFISGRSSGTTRDLPLAPQTVTKVLGLTDSEPVDRLSIADVTNTDPSIAAYVVGAAIWEKRGEPGMISSLPQAESHLGRDAVVEVVTAAAMEARLFTSSTEVALLSQLARHSVATALVAAEIARVRGSDPDVLYLCGLLHDLGRVVVLDSLRSFERALGSKLAPTLRYELLQQMHEQMGGKLAAAWGLPDMVVNCLLHHHNYRAAVLDREAVMTVHFSDLLAQTLVADISAPARSVDEIAQLPVASELGLRPDFVMSIDRRKEELFLPLVAMRE